MGPHLVLMVIALVGPEGGLRVMGAPFETIAACEAAKPDVTAKAVAAGFPLFGLSCVDVPMGRPS